jgi:hypothetical protein
MTVLAALIALSAPSESEHELRPSRQLGTGRRLRDTFDRRKDLDPLPLISLWREHL